MATQENKGQKKKLAVDVGAEVFVNGKLLVVAQVLSGRGGNITTAKEMEKPSITAHRTHHNKVLLNNIVFLNTDYSLKPH